MRSVRLRPVSHRGIATVATVEATPREHTIGPSNSARGAETSSLQACFRPVSIGKSPGNQIHVVFGVRVVGASCVRRMERPLSSMRWASWSRRSQMASAWLGSPMTVCQSVTGSWLAMRVEARSARSSMTGGLVETADPRSVPGRRPGDRGGNRLPGGRRPRPGDRRAQGPPPIAVEVTNHGDPLRQQTQVGAGSTRLSRGAGNLQLPRAVLAPKSPASWQICPANVRESPTAPAAPTARHGDGGQASASIGESSGQPLPERRSSDRAGGENRSTQRAPSPPHLALLHLAHTVRFRRFHGCAASGANLTLSATRNL